MAGQKGANSVYSRELVDAIARVIATGTPKKFAAQANGISYDTLNDWEKGKGGIPNRTEVLHLLQVMQRAEGQAVAARVARIAKAGQKGDWRADAWYLEHVHSDDFAASTKSKNETELSSKDGKPFGLTLNVVGAKLEPEPEPDSGAESGAA